MSPLAMAARTAPRVMLSMRRADAVSAPSAKTPTATQSALNASGNAIFVLNSIGLAVFFLRWENGQTRWKPRSIAAAPAHDLPARNLPGIEQHGRGCVHGAVLHPVFGRAGAHPGRGGQRRDRQRRRGLDTGPVGADPAAGRADADRV